MTNLVINRRVTLTAATQYNADALLYFNAADIISYSEKKAVSNWADATQSMRDGGKILSAQLISPTSFSSSLYCFERLIQITYQSGRTPNWSATDGWDFNGVIQYLKSAINASTDVPLNDGGISVWSLSDNAVSGISVGCNIGATNSFYITPEGVANTAQFGSYNSATVLTGAADTSNEFFAGYVISSTSRKLYRAQVEIGTSSTVTSTPPSLEMYVGSSNTSGSAANFRLGKIGAVFITKGLTPT